MAVRIFISYSSSDRVIVDRIKDMLARAGADVWLDHERLKAGTPSWQSAIRKGIQRATHVIYVASEAAARSDYVFDEISIAKSRRKSIIPFWIHGADWHECVPIGFGAIQHIDGRGARFDTGLEDLLTALGLSLPKPHLPPDPLPVAPTPSQSTAPGSETGVNIPTEPSPNRQNLTEIAPEPASSAPTRRRRVQLVIPIAALLLVIVGGWYFGFGPPAAQRAANQQAQTRLSSARQIIQQANSQTPTAALQSLSQARAIVLTEVNNKAVDPSLRTQAQNLLDQELAPAVQQALQRYNSAAHITQTTINSAVAFTINCVTPTEKTPTPITATSGLAPVSAPSGSPAIISGRQVVYFISGGALYEALIPVSAQNTPILGVTICAPVTIKGASAYLSIVGYGGSVFALTQLAAGGYSVIRVTPGALSTTGAPTMKAATFLLVPTTKQTPTHLAIYGHTVYVSYTIGSNSFGVLYFSGLSKSKPQAIGLPSAATSLLAVNNSLFLLLADGTLGQLNAAHVFIPLPVTATLPATATPPDTYTAATPVPTPQGTESAATSTPFGSGSQLIADPLDATQFLVSDPGTLRFIQLVTAASGPGVGLVGQYTYGSSLTNVGDVAMTGAGSTLNTYVWSNAQLVTFTLPA